MFIATIPNQPAPVYAAPVTATQSRLLRATIYMPSSVALRLLGPLTEKAEGREAKSVKPEA